MKICPSISGHHSIQLIKCSSYFLVLWDRLKLVLGGMSSLANYITLHQQTHQTESAIYSLSLIYSLVSAMYSLLSEDSFFSEFLFFSH